LQQSSALINRILSIFGKSSFTSPDMGQGRVSCVVLPGKTGQEGIFCWISKRMSAFLALLAVCGLWLAGTQGTQDAIANGDTRTLSLYHQHTKESLTVTFKRWGSYDSDALKQLNWLLRDWRREEATKMDPRLFDIAWEVHRESGSREPLHVVSAYRSPTTNAMLRRRSRGVAKHSQHTLGKAMDFHLPDVDMGRVRSIGMRLQRGGVGYYPGAHTPFVHLDAGSVRSWPRMPRDQLARLFPDGRTVHIPADGKPMGGYEVAKAEILATGGAVSGYAAFLGEGEESSASSGRQSLWATLFGGGDDEDSDYLAATQKTRSSKRGVARTASVDRQGGITSYAPSVNSEDGGSGGAMVAMMTGQSGFTSPRPYAYVPTPREPVAVAALSPPANSSEAASIRAVESKSPDSVIVAPIPVARPASQETPPTATASTVPPIRVEDNPPASSPPSVPSLTPPSVMAALLPPVRPQDRIKMLDIVAETVPASTVLMDGPLPPRRPQQGSAVIVVASRASSPEISSSNTMKENREKPRPVITARQDDRRSDRAALRALFTSVALDHEPANTGSVSVTRTRSSPLPDRLSMAPSTLPPMRFQSNTTTLRTDRFLRTGS
jgi:uncharacterized protein YcbK (DUF882 family)